MLLSMVEKYAKSLGPPRVIFGRDGTTPYLSRYYLSRQPTMPDGSIPFDSLGNPKPDVIWPTGIGVYLHHFHRGDEDAELHSHPWDWCFSIVLTGGYFEERRMTDAKGHYTIVRWVGPGRINVIRNDDFHRVILNPSVSDPVWTLFVVGKKSQGWGFWNKETNELTPWREFLARRQVPRPNTTNISYFSSILNDAFVGKEIPYTAYPDRRPR